MLLVASVDSKYVLLFVFLHRVKPGAVKRARLLSSPSVIRGGKIMLALGVCIVFFAFCWVAYISVTSFVFAYSLTFFHIIITIIRIFFIIINFLTTKYLFFKSTVTCNCAESATKFNQPSFFVFLFLLLRTRVIIAYWVGAILQLIPGRNLEKVEVNNSLSWSVVQRVIANFSLCMKCAVLI